MISFFSNGVPLAMPLRHFYFADYPASHPLLLRIYIAPYLYQPPSHHSFFTTQNRITFGSSSNENIVATAFLRYRT